MAATETAAIVTVCLALLEIVKVLIGKLRGPKDPNRDLRKAIEQQTTAIREIQSKTELLYKMHDVRDEDGSPLWYVPRSWSKTQREVVEICQSISATQHNIANALERLERRG